MGMVALLIDVPLSAIRGREREGQFVDILWVYDGVEGRKMGRPSLWSVKK